MTLTYRPHATRRCRQLRLTHADVVGIITNPVRGTYEPKGGPRLGTRNYYGYSLDGREIGVVTNLAVTVVITVFDEVKYPGYDKT